jgi:hypothetical protein
VVAVENDTGDNKMEDPSNGIVNDTSSGDEVVIATALDSCAVFIHSWNFVDRRSGVLVGRGTERKVHVFALYFVKGCIVCTCKQRK